MRDYIEPALAMAPTMSASGVVLENTFGDKTLAGEGKKGAIRSTEDLRAPVYFSDKRHVPHPNIIHPPKPEAQLV